MQLRVLTDFPLISHNCVSLKIFACFRFRSNIFTFITCPVNSFILWDAFSVEKSVIWVVFGKQRLIIRNAIASVAVPNGSQIWHFYRIITLRVDR